MKVIGIGDNVVDDYTNIRMIFPGGNALNFAVYASMLGCEASYLGVFGSDVAAAHVQRTLAELGIDTSHCRSADGPNGRALLTVEDGERRFVGSNEGGIRKSIPMAFILDDLEYLRTFAVMHTSAYSYMDSYLPALRSLNIPLSYDFSDDFDVDQALPLCQYVDFGFFSCAEWTDAATMDLLDAAVSGGCTLAAATRGPLDAIAFDGRTWFRQAPQTMTPVDTLGAGDAFISGFLVSYIGGNTASRPQGDLRIPTSLDKAATFAASICQVQGAFGQGLHY